MKNFYFLFSVLFIMFSNSIYCMHAPASSASQTELGPNLTIINEIPHKLELKYEYSDKNPQTRTIAENEEFLVKDIQNLELLTLEPYGEYRGLVSASSLTLGYIQPYNFAQEISSKLREFGNKNLELTISPRGAATAQAVSTSQWLKGLVSSTIGEILPYAHEFTVAKRKFEPGSYIYEVFPAVKQAKYNNQPIYERYFLNIAQNANEQQITEAYRERLAHFISLRDNQTDSDKIAYYNEAIKFVQAAYDSLILKGEAKTRFEKLVAEDIIDAPYAYLFRNEEEQAAQPAKAAAR